MIADPALHNQPRSDHAENSTPAQSVPPLQRCRPELRVIMSRLHLRMSTLLLRGGASRWNSLRRQQYGHEANNTANTPSVWLVECCFTSTETVGLLGTGAQDGHLDFHTTPELWLWISNSPPFVVFHSNELATISLLHLGFLPRDFFSFFFSFFLSFSFSFSLKQNVFLKFCFKPKEKKKKNP